MDTGSIPVYSTYNNTADLPQIKLERLIYKGFRLYFFLVILPCIINFVMKFVTDCVREKSQIWQLYEMKLHFVWMCIWQSIYCKAFVAEWAYFALLTTAVYPIATIKKWKKKKRTNSLTAFDIIRHGILPLLFLCLPEMIGVPIWVVWYFVKDVCVVLLVSSSLLFSVRIYKIFYRIHWRMKMEKFDWILNEAESKTERCDTRNWIWISLLCRTETA